MSILFSFNKKKKTDSQDLFRITLFNFVKLSKKG